MSEKLDTLIADINQRFDNQLNHNPQSVNISDKPSLQYGEDKNGQNHDSHEPNNKIMQKTQQNEGETNSEGNKDRKNTPLQNTAVKKKINENKINSQTLNSNGGHNLLMEENSYRSLTNKLQTALKKINTHKTQTNKLNKNKTMNLLSRFNDHERKKQREIEQKRLAEEEKKYLGLKPKPDINPKSRKIAQQTSHKPIYERFEKILEDKKKKMEQNQQDKKAKQEEEYEKFISEYESHVKLHTEDCRNSDTFFHDMVTWKSKLDKQKEEKHKLKEQKQVQGLTFKPQLNKKSMKIAERVKRVPIEERQTARNYNQEPGYTFQPKPFKKRNI